MKIALWAHKQWIQNKLFPLGPTGCSLGVRHKYLLGPKNRSVLYCTYHPPVRRTIKCAPKTVVCGTIGLRTRFILLGFTGFYWVLLDFSEFRESSRRLRGGGVRLWVQSPLSTGCTQRYPYKQGVSHHLSTCYHRTAQPKGFFFGDTCRPTKLHHIFFAKSKYFGACTCGNSLPCCAEKSKTGKQAA